MKLSGYFRGGGGTGKVIMAKCKMADLINLNSEERNHYNSCLM